MKKKTPLLLLLMILPIVPVFAQHPTLYFTAQDTASLRAVWRSAATFPEYGFKAMLAHDRWIGAPVRPSKSDEWADYDREKAHRAKALAFRYLMERDTADGDPAFEYLSTKYEADGYTYQSDNYARWMTNGLALIDYCAAYDFLAGADYFTAARHAGSNAHDSTWWSAQRSAIVSHLRDKAAAIYARVKTARTGSDAFSAQLFGNQTMLNEVKFHAQVGNHRIITASALGVAAYALRADAPASETNAWLEFAARDVEQFLLHRERYAPATDKQLRVLTQNIGGVFPEGMEYLNYSGEGFVPFMIASMTNGGEDYTQDANFRQLMEWVYDIQAPDGSAPQINSTGYGVFPINGLFAAVMPGSAHYMAQLASFTAAYGFNGTSPVEAFWLLRNAAPGAEKPFDRITVSASRSEIVMRDKPAHPARFVLISSKNGAARSAAELHAYADAGSYIFASDNRTHVRHPGYAGYSASRELETASAHNTVTPVVNGVPVYDAPDRSQALPPSADAAVTRTKTSDAFSYVGVSMEINGTKPVSNGDIVAITSSILSLRYEYISSTWMASRINMINYGTCSRQFLLVNNMYLVIMDDVTRKDPAMQYAVSSIHGNNGNHPTAETAIAGATSSERGETVWTSGTLEALRANIAVFGGAEKQYSRLDPAIHQSPDASNPGDARAKYYHAALRTAAPFIGGKAKILSLLEIDPSSAERSSVTTRRSGANDSSTAAFTVDGRGRRYGRYDVVFAQKEHTPASIAVPDLQYPVTTDASFLVMSFPPVPAGASDVKLFTQNASFVSYGPYTFVPSDTGDAQTSFTITTAMAASARADAAPATFLLAQNYPNPFNPVTRIPYSIPRVCDVSLTVHDMLGRMVVRLVDGVMTAGTHEAVLDASRLASGPYFYRLRAGNQVAERMMMLLK